MATTESARQGKAAATKRAADVVEKVYRRVKEMAVAYRFRPGARVNEVELAQRFDVSRTPVRQALSRLAHEQFVTFVPNRGFFAREIAPDDVRQIYEYRALIEAGAFRLACELATAADIDAAARNWAASTDGIGDWRALAQADEAFHVGIAAMAGNPYIVKALEEVNAKLRFFRQIDLEDKSRRDNTYKEHDAILHCLRRGDSSGAEILRDHIVMSSDRAVEVTKEGLARIFFETVR